MTLDINERRKRLRAALASTDTGDVSGFAAAFAGANEEDRAALSRTVPTTKLFKAEGPTPRACFVLAALGKPTVVVETIQPRWITSDGGALYQDETHEKLVREAAPVMEEFLLAAAHDRDRAWQLAFIDALAESGWGLADRTWPLARALIEDHALAPESANYLGWFLRHLTPNAREGQRDAEELAARLTASNGALLAEFWALFRVDGMGGHWGLTGHSFHTGGDNGDVWHAAINILCDTVPGFRDRILDESLNALLRAFSAKNSVWYPRVHRSLDPTPEEIAARADTYEALLVTGLSATVGLAQDMLSRAVDRIAPVGLVHASVTVLSRSEKKLLTAQLKLLAAAVKAHPECAAQVTALVFNVVETLPVDIAVTARKLILSGQTVVLSSDAVFESATPGAIQSMDTKKYWLDDSVTFTP